MHKNDEILFIRINISDVEISMRINLAIFVVAGKHRNERWWKQNGLFSAFRQLKTSREISHRILGELYIEFTMDAVHIYDTLSCKFYYIMQERLCEGKELRRIDGYENYKED